MKPLTIKSIYFEVVVLQNKIMWLGGNDRYRIISDFYTRDFKDGVWHGFRIIYDKDGSVMLKDVWENGHIVI